MGTEFKESIHRADNNANLTGTLGKFSEVYKVNRAKAYEGIDFEELRGRIAELKSYAAGHLDELSELFAHNAETAGAKVFRTNDLQRAFWENKLGSLEKQRSRFTIVCNHVRRLFEAAWENRFALISKLVAWEHRLSC
jgi:L-lactate utilization protein LutB